MYTLLTVAIETLGSYGPHVLDFTNDIGHRIKESTGKKQATSYQMQARCVAIQRGNSQCILGMVKDTSKMDYIPLLARFFAFNFKSVCCWSLF